MKVLFYAYAFPPARFPASVRTWNIARALADDGCEVSVVTLPPEAWRYVDESDTGNHGVRRIEARSRWQFLAPWDLMTSPAVPARIAGGIARRAAQILHVDPESGWKIEAARATAALTRSDVDVILATGRPFTSFDVARRLAARLGRPYILDYRDLWNGNPHGNLSHGVRAEADIIRDAAAVVAVSPSMLRTLDDAFGIDGKGRVVPNGYAESEMQAVQPARFDHFAIVYTGQFYPPKRVPKPLLEALRSIRVAGWKFHYAGPAAADVAAAAADLGLSDRIVFHGNVSRRESLSLVAGADVAVVITTVQATADDADRGIMTSKVFDIIGLRRPMLIIAPPGTDIEALVAGRTETACLPAHDRAGIAAFIDMIAERRQPASPMPELSWRARGGEVSRLVREVAGR